MSKLARIFSEESVIQIVDEHLDARLGGGPPMDTHFEKHLDTRFAHIEADVAEIRSDLRDIRSEVRGLKFWYVGTTLVVIGIIIALFTYHAQVMQSQFQVFSEYVKAVTQPQIPKAPSQ